MAPLQVAKALTRSRLDWAQSAWSCDGWRYGLPQPLALDLADERVVLDPAGEGPSFAVGSAVRLKERLAYLKTADPMPMLRPPDLVDGDERGMVVAVRSRGLLAVRFRRGTFLLPTTVLSAC